MYRDWNSLTFMMGVFSIIEHVQWLFSGLTAKPFIPLRILFQYLTDKNIMPPQARIDSHNKILYARHADQRNATFQRVLQTGSEFDRDVRAMLLRANLIKLEYKASRKP